jgi:hypothetical protein
MSVLMNMSGTAGTSAYATRMAILFPAHLWLSRKCDIGGMNVLLISVRTEDTKFMSRAFTLASSRWPPKPGSVADDVQPTAPCVSIALWTRGGVGIGGTVKMCRRCAGAWCFAVRFGKVRFRTSCEESVF